MVLALQEKCRAHGVNVDLEQGLPTDDVEAARVYWEQALNRLVTEQLLFGSVVARIDAYLQQLATAEG